MATRHTLIAVSEDMKTLRDIEEIAGATFNVVATRSAERAISLLKTDGSAAAIVADQELSGAGGIEVLTAAMAAKSSVRRVLVSGQGHLAEIVEGLHAGVIERILYKPIRDHELIAALNVPGVAMKRATA